MKIETEQSRYYGDTGWESDPLMFAEVAVTWQQWIGQSGEHLYAAQILLSHVEQRHRDIKRWMESKQHGTVQMVPSLTGIYFLHCAFCIENAFKCLISHRHATEIKREIAETHRIPKLLLSHDLVQLAGRAAFPVGPDEEYAFTFLARYGTWAGRYPIPVKNADNAGTSKLSDGNHYMMAGYNPDHVHGFLKLANTIYSWVREQLGTEQR